MLLNRPIYFLLAGIIIIVTAVLTWKLTSTTPSALVSQSELKPASVPDSNQIENPSVIPPIAEFQKRITKKSFGTYITPTNSPVSPESFTGYHTGVDVEYADVTSDVPVSGIADGLVVTSESISGYGGVMVIKHEIKGRTLYAIYGHLRPASMLKAETTVTKGEKVAVLGTAFSRETDNERRHLHFGVALSNTILGYVSTSDRLNSSWINPLSLYR